ncbi:hypothetical protein [Oceanobacillus massiliensis]|uniref:hypothetical protein n=1 Tax=Oceanobacillus massiliensis TaxID=1465765 RepID=UPI0013760531|nr:hypothetical protein [Oceanobacillus massiliensis]
MNKERKPAKVFSTLAGFFNWINNTEESGMAGNQSKERKAPIGNGQNVKDWRERN